MIQVPDEVKRAFRSDNCLRNLVINFPASETLADITDVQITKEEFELDESICSDEQLRFGACESSVIGFEIKYDSSVSGIIGEIIDVYLQFSTVPDYNFYIGRYIIDSDQVSNDRETRSIEAFDVMYFIRNADVTDWYYSLEWPMTVKQLRDSLFTFIGMNQNEQHLINDDITLPDATLSDPEIYAGNVLEYICEINAAFGHIGRDNTFHYITLYNASDPVPLYPGSTTYPGGETYPGSNTANAYLLDREYCQENMVWSLYQSNAPDSVQLRNASGNVLLDYLIGTSSENIYVIQNPLLDNLDEGTLTHIAYNFGQSVKGIYYTPASITAIADLSIEVGDAILFKSEDGTTYKTYVLTRNTRGIQSMFDSYASEGNEYYSFSEPNTNAAMQSQINDLNTDLSDVDDRVSALENSSTSLRVMSVSSEPANPQTGVIYLIQGTVVVN